MTRPLSSKGNTAQLEPRLSGWRGCIAMPVCPNVGRWPYWHEPRHPLEPFARVAA